MKKLLTIALVLISLSLVSCFDTETNTEIKADGSGTTSATVDLSKVFATLATMNNKEKEEASQPVDIDTIFGIRSLTDTAAAFTTEQKRLLQGQFLHLTMVAGQGRESKMILSVQNSFKSLADLTALTALMQTPAYNEVFNKAVDIPELGGGTSVDGSGEDDITDNILIFVSPDFFNFSYKKGEIKCELNPDRYKSTRMELKLDNPDEESESVMQVLEAAKFTNVVTLPGNIKSLSGPSMKAGDNKNTLSQSGSISSMFEHPEKYVYRITYK